MKQQESTTTPDLSADDVAAINELLARHAAIVSLTKTERAAASQLDRAVKCDVITPESDGRASERRAAAAGAAQWQH